MTQTAKVKVTADTRHAQAGFKKLSTGLRDVKRAAGLATVAITAMVFEAAKFQTGMANVSTLLDDQAKNLLPEWGNRIKEMQIEFGESSRVLQKGLFDIISASVDASKAMEVLKVAAISAKAGMADTAITVDAITTILNSFKLAAEEAASVSDLLFVINLRGKTTLGEVAQNIGQVASTASVAGFQLEEFAGLISTLTRNGIKTTEAMTSVQGVLSAFLMPMDESINLARKFGFELNTNTLRTEGLVNVLHKLKEATSEELAVLFPNIRALKGVSAALQDVEGYAKDVEMQLKRDGATQKAFQTMAETAETQFSRVAEAAKALASDLGEILLPPVTAVAEKLAESTKGFRETMKSQGGGAKGFFKSLLSSVVGLIGTDAGDIKQAQQMILGSAPSPAGKVKMQTKGVSIARPASRMPLAPSVALPEITAEVEEMLGAFQEMVPAFKEIKLQSTEQMDKWIEMLTSFAQSYKFTMDNMFMDILSGQVEFSKRMNELWRNLAMDVISVVTDETSKWLAKKTGGLIKGLLGSIPGVGALVGLAENG